MPLISHPQPFRLTQLTFSISFLVLLVYAAANHGYWTNITAAIFLGVTTSVITQILTGYHVFTLHRTNTTARMTAPSASRLASVGKLAVETLALLSWAGTAASMLRPKGKDFKLLFDDPPYVTWTLGVVLAMMELVGFVLSTVSVFGER